MTPEAAVYGFLSQFGIPAYPASSTPAQAEFPYLTYDLVISGGWNDGEVNIPVSLWYWTDSEAVPNAKVREISAAIGAGGVTVPCDGGMLWIKRGSPWAQAMVDGAEEPIKRRYLNIDIEFIVLD